ncbi:N-alpha-acetyltransferase 15, NatA auxiliary subunit-like isoform X2 [Artemia franciscana]
MPSSNPLPPKENTLFKRVVRCYEQKQYKNGLKFAKQILSNPKFSQHGETLAMKGLTLNCLGKKEEAYELVRLGLKNDLKSHVCWHVYGLLQRADKKYDEAIRCYRNALKCDKENVQILRDLSLLQIHLRDLEGYKETRHQLLLLRPAQRVSWIGYAMAHHLLKEYDVCLEILNEFSKTTTKVNYDYEQSELFLYQAQVILESGDLEGVLEHLSTYEDQICDKLSLKEMRADILYQLGKPKESEVLYRELLKRNQENRQYFIATEKCQNCLNDEDKLNLYENDLKIQYPKSSLVKRIPLAYAHRDKFRELVDQYMKVSFRKGVPPLFIDLRTLYNDPEKVKTIEDLILGYVKNLKTSEKFSILDPDPKEPASAILWCYFYLAQHFDYLGKVELALQYIDAAIEHTPTLIDAFVVRGKIFKHAGDPIEAYKCLDEAQSLDTADRFINSKAAKYMLRANLIQEAEEMCSKFTREGVSATENLNEMQCMWFQTESAAAYKRLGMFGEALKKCHEVERHFSEMVDDQFDFHTYCMRKMTLRSYMTLLRLEDKIRDHNFYFKAASCAIDVYLQLYDNPNLADEQPKENGEVHVELSANEKKLKSKLKKAQKKAEMEKAMQKEQNEKREMHMKNKQNPQDREPEPPSQDELIPSRLLKTDSPLKEAIKFLMPLQQLQYQRLETHLYAFEIYIRKQKPLLVIRSLKRAVKVAGVEHPKVKACLIRFMNTLPSFGELNPLVKEVIDKTSQSLLNGQSVNQLLEVKSAECVLEGLKILRTTQGGRQKIEETLQHFDELEGLSLRVAEEIYNLVLSRELPASETLVHELRAKFSRNFPFAALFRQEDQASKGTSIQDMIASLSSQVGSLQLDDGTSM